MDKSDHEQPLLATIPPSIGQRRTARVFMLALVASVLATWPFATIKLAAIDSFVPTLAAALLITYGVTAALLFGQFSIQRQRALLVIANGYLISGLMVFAHALAFPGAFSPTGLNGAGLQSAVLLYSFWHLALPFAAIGYALLKDADRAVSTGSTRFAIGSSVAAMIVLAGAIFWFLTRYQALLPITYVDAQPLSFFRTRIGGIVDTAITGAAVGVMWVRRKTLLDEWLVVALCAIVTELVLAAILTGDRFTVAWYAARLYQVVAAAVVMIVLLAETTALYAEIARSNTLLHRERLLLKEVGEAVRARELDLRKTIDAIPALVWSARVDGSAEFFNQHYLDQVRLSLAQAQDWGWSAAVHPDDLSRLAATWQAIMASGQAGEAEARLRGAGQDYRWFLFRASPLRDESGKIVSWYGVNIDIEDRKRAEEELRRNEGFLAAGQRLSLTGTFTWRSATEEFVWSEELYRIYELEPGTRITFELIASRYHPEDKHRVADIARQARNGVTSFDYGHRLLMPDGSIKNLHVVAHGGRDKDGNGLEYFGAVQDVTRRRRAEEERDKVRSELAHVARIMSLSALTASIAHEVNQPLAGITTNANTCLRMLAADPPNIEGARETARRTIRDGNRAADVIGRLRALFGKKATATETLNLNEAAREVLALLSDDLARNSVLLRVELGDDPLLVTGDRVQLQQVILNLVRNASEAMADVDDRPRHLVVRTDGDEKGCARLIVQDSGVGFASQDAERFFDAFYTTKSDGMGIGLSLCRSIIESHDGRLWAEPNDGPGATFSFCIPTTSSR